MAYDLTHVGTVVARSMLWYSALSLVVFGIQLFMSIYGFTVYLETPPSMRKGRIPYIIISFLLSGFLGLSSVVDLSFLFRLLFNSTSPKDFTYMRETTGDWSIVLSQVLSIASTFLADGLMVYRCYIIWLDAYWITILPALVYVASVVFRILFFLPMLDNMSQGNTNITYLSIFLFLSVFLNILVTGLIAFRLIRARASFSRILSHKDLTIYTGVLAILIESALPLSVFGLGYGIVLAIMKSGDPDLLQKTVANYVFSAFYSVFMGLSPQMIIFRVTTGRSWTSGFRRTTKSIADNGILVFARTNNGDEERTTSSLSTSDLDNSQVCLEDRIIVEEKEKQLSEKKTRPSRIEADPRG